MAAGIDGTSVIFAGATYGSWANTTAGDGYEDFAGMAMDADKAVLWKYQVSCRWRMGRVIKVSPLSLKTTKRGVMARFEIS